MAVAEQNAKIYRLGFEKVGSQSYGLRRSSLTISFCINFWQPQRGRAPEGEKGPSTYVWGDKTCPRGDKSCPRGKNSREAP